jgi:hypothetical protein
MNKSQEKPEYVLFIMKSCKFCNNFITRLKTKPELFSKFNIVDIEEIPSIPAEVTEVPCVYDGKQVYLSKNSFKWLNEKLSDFLLPANDSLMYSFIDGSDEQVFNNYSLLNQLNGSNGIGDSPIKSSDPARLTKLGNEDNKKGSLESLIASREAEIYNIKK